MNNTEFIKSELNKYGQNEIIFASKLYKEVLFNKQVSELSFYKTLERMYKKKEIEKLSKGIYYFPKNSKYGIIPISDEEIASVFTNNNSGMIVGYKLYNKLKLTTQISKNYNIYSSNVTNTQKKIRNIEIKNIQINFSKEYIRIIEMLEVLQNYYEIQDLNYFEFYNYAKKFSFTYNEKATKIILEKIPYKKSTISFLYNILNYFKIENSLNSYLSTLSKYNHMSMEDVYELARTQKWF